MGNLCRLYPLNNLANIILVIVTALFLVSCFLTHCDTAHAQDDFSNSYYKKLCDQAEVKEARVIMVGDSLVSMYDFDGVANFGIAGDTIDGVRNRLDMVRRLNPKVTFVLIGSNDIIDYDVPRMCKRYVIYVYNPLKKTDTLVIAITLPYVSESIELSSQKNRKIDEFNKFLRERYFVLDLNKATEEDGYLKDEYSLDGVHLNEEGYRVFNRMVVEMLKATEDPKDA